MDNTGPFLRRRSWRKEGFGSPKFLSEDRVQKMRNDELRTVIGLNPAGSHDCRLAARELDRRKK